MTKSTNVRILSAALRSLSRVAPELTARWLVRLFLTTRTYPTPDRERAWMRDATPLALTTSRGTPLAGWSWGSGPNVLLAHGWNGRGSQMGAFVEPLVAQGFRVITWDAPGHGHSPGRRSSLPEVAWSIRDVADQLGGAHAIIAHSMGGAAAALAIALGLDTERLVLISAPENPGLFLYKMADYLGLRPAIAARAQRRIERRFGIDWTQLRPSNPNRRRAGELLVIHDRDDREVVFEEAHTFADTWPGARLWATEGLGHRRVLRDADVVSAATLFVAGLSAPDSDDGQTRDLEMAYALAS